MKAQKTLEKLNRDYLSTSNTWNGKSFQEKRRFKPYHRPNTFRVFLCSIGLMAVFLFGSHIFLSSNMVHMRQVEVLTSSLNPVDLVKELPSSRSIRDKFIYYATHAHLAGSEQDPVLANWTQDRFSHFGLQNASIQVYYPFLNYPLERKLAVVNGSQELLYNATLNETNHDITPTFHAYSADGNVTGPVVYVNFGRLEDFVWLTSQSNISVKGTIALVRHGKIPSSIKVQNAEQFGCIGALVYNDPADTDLPTLVHRESVSYAHFYPGDPSTPGFASTLNATVVENTTMAGIPSLPISWSDALPLFRITQNLGLTDSLWLGGSTQVDYFTGPSEALVNLVNLNKVEKKPIWNVVSRIQGLEEPEKAIIVGAQRDAWSLSAADPSSGSAVLLELARVFGILLEKGWKPRRSILFVSWDASEYGNVGSTEWVEDHTSWLKKHAVAYLDISHAAVTGPNFSAQASPLLHRLLKQVTSMLIDPKTSQTVYEAWLDHYTINDWIPMLIPPVSTAKDANAFYHYAGVPSLSISFTGEKYDVSHSTFDSISWMERFGDPTFEYHQTLVKILALLTLRLSDDVVLPLNPVDYTYTMLQCLDQIVSQEPSSNKSSEQELPALYHAIHALHKASNRFNDKVGHVESRLNHYNNLQETFKHHHDKKKKLYKKIHKLNEHILNFERNFVDNKGLLISRPWYKHVIFGPSAKSGHMECFPSLMESKALEDLDMVSQNEQVLAEVLRKAKSVLL